MSYGRLLGQVQTRRRIDAPGNGKYSHAECNYRISRSLKSSTGQSYFVDEEEERRTWTVETLVPHSNNRHVASVALDVCVDHRSCVGR